MANSIQRHARRGASIPHNTGWASAVELLSRYLQAPTKADDLLADLPDGMDVHARRRCKALFIGAVRWLGLHEAVFAPLVRKNPRPILEALLYIAAEEIRCDISEKEGQAAPKIINFAVDTAKKMTSAGEARFANAVLRKVPDALRARLESAAPEDAAALATRYSHPEWLVQRWLPRFGRENTLSLLQSNQQPAPTYLRCAKMPEGHGFKPTPWPDFYEVPAEAWPAAEALMRDGKAYAMDPAQRNPAELLAAQPGETVLDLCAAPGGKSRMIAEALGQRGRLVAFDLPGPRIARLRENLAHLSGCPIDIVEADLLQTTPETFTQQKLPPAFDAVLLDAPCSNTGVLRRRPDTRWRLTPGDVTECATLQLALLHRAAEFVKPGGRLVYSTCSIEPEENAELIATFLDSLGEDPPFTLAQKLESYPWEHQHDGAAAYRLNRK